MPKYQNENVTCPDCGKSFKVKQFTRIDPQTMNRQREGVFNETLFQEKCPYCHKVNEYPYSFSWREARSHMNIVFAASAEDKEELLREYEGEDDIRVVDNRDEFMEKVMIFHAGLDDTESLKLRRLSVWMPCGRKTRKLSLSDSLIIKWIRTCTDRYCVE